MSSPCSYQSLFNQTDVTYAINSNSVEEILSGWTELFSNPNSCVDPFICLLYLDDCSTTLTNNQRKYIDINTMSPFAVTIDRTLVQGWSLAVCYKCFSAQNAGFNDSWKVSLTGICPNNLQDTDSQPSSTSALTYQESPNFLGLTSTYLDIFKEVNASCPTVTGCNLYDSTCITLLDSSYSDKVEIQSVSPWLITQYRNVEAGYPAFQMCFKCVSDMQNDGLTFTMTLSQGIDCSTHLVASDTPMTNPLVLEYSSTEIQFEIATGWTDGLIKNIDEINCGAITSCQIYEDDGVTTLPNSINPYVTLGANPWPIYADRSISLGFTYDIKLKCVSSTSSKEIPWVITVNLDCSKQISQKSSAPSQTSSLSYSTSNSGLQNLGTFDTIFQNSVTNCPEIDSCAIFQSDCQTSLSFPESDYVIILDSNPWTIFQKTNVATGYLHFQVCYKCVSSADINGANFVMTLSQTLDCSNHIQNANVQQASHVTLPYTGETQTLATGYLDQIFKLENPTECGYPSSCKIGYSNCSQTDHFGSFVQAEGISWAIKANQGIPGGWSASFCYFCESPNQTIQRSFIWEVQQYDCSSNFEQNSQAPNSFIFSYNQTASMKFLFYGWTSLFLNKNSLMCPDPIACQVYASDCKSPYSGQNIIVRRNSTWALEVVQNVLIGWNQTFCYGCSSTAQTIVSRQIMVQQLLECSNHLVDHRIQKKNFLTLPFEEKDVTIAKGWSDEIFENTDPVNCGKITRCQLFKDDCMTQLDSIESQQIMVGANDPWELNAVTSFASGWNLKICYKCFSEQVPLGKSFNWHIQQVDCNQSLIFIDKSLQKELVHPYREQPSFNVQIKSWDQVFQNINSVQCPVISSCGLFKYGCIKKYDGDKFILDSESPWSLKIIQNSIQEWTEEVCYKCESAASSISYTQKFTQTQDPGEFLIFTPSIQKQVILNANNSQPKSQNVTIQKEVENQELINTTRVILKKEKYFTARIQEITANSLVKIKFSQSMMDQYDFENLSMINSISLQVILDNQKVHIQSWTIVEFIDQNLVLKLNISDPFIVSQDKRDSLIIQFINPAIFQVKEGDLLMDQDSKIIKAGIQKQMKYNVGTDVLVGAVESIDTGIISVLSIQGGLNIVIAISIAQILNMFHPLQIMVFESMLKIGYPANATFLSSSVSKIINLDVLDPDFIGQILFNYSLSDAIAEDPNYEIDENNAFILIPQIQDQGYESYHPILNLGGIFIIMSMFVAQIVFVAVLILLTKCSKALKYDKFQPEGGDIQNQPSLKDKFQKSFYILVRSKMKKMVAQMFFTSFIVLVNESVIQLTMASYLFTFNKNQPNHDQDSGTPINNFFTWFTIIYCYTALILITLLSLYISAKISKKDLNLKSFKQKFDFLYKDLQQDDMLSLSQPLIFIMRRLVLCFVFLRMQETPAQQIQLLLLMNLIIFIYIGNVQPIKLRSQNRIEVVNEFLIVQLSLQFVIFTPFVPNHDSQYDVGGFMYIGFMMTSIVFNFYFLAASTFRYFRMIFLICYKRLSLKYEVLQNNIQLNFHKTLYDFKANFHNEDQIFNNIIQKNESTVETKNDNISQFQIKENVPQIFIIPSDDNTPDNTLLLGSINSSEKIYKQKKEKMFELRRKVLKQKQIELFVQNAKNYKFEQLKKSKISNQEKSHVFYQIKAALHIEKKFTTQTKEQDLTAFVIDFLLKNVMPVTKFSIYENMMKELKWDYIQEVYLKQNFPNIVEELIEDHHLFSLAYDKNLAWKSENECFQLNIQSNGFGEQLWTSEEVNELVKMKTFPRKTKLNGIFQNSDDKDSALRKIQRLYIMIDNYQQSQIDRFMIYLDPKSKYNTQLENIINLIQANYTSQIIMLVDQI